MFLLTLPSFQNTVVRLKEAVVFVLLGHVVIADYVLRVLALAMLAASFLAFVMVYPLLAPFILLGVAGLLFAMSHVPQGRAALD